MISLIKSDLSAYFLFTRVIIFKTSKILQFDYSLAISFTAWTTSSAVFI